MIRRTAVHLPLFGLAAAVLAVGVARAPAIPRHPPLRRLPSPDAAAPISLPTSDEPDPPIGVELSTPAGPPAVLPIPEEDLLARDHMDPDEYRIYLELRRQEEAERRRSSCCSD